jgi:[ribosomal protein S5]-alanine N-acetyltransferase
MTSPSDVKNAAAASLLESCGGPALRIDTDKSVLRPLTEDDLSERYLGWLNDVEVNRFSSRRNRTFTFDDMTENLCQATASWDRLLLGLFERGSCVHIGNVQFQWVDRESGVADISNLLGERSRWGSGVVVDADKHLIHFAFQCLEARKIVMGNIAPHRASTFKSTSLGAQLEGRMRSHKRFGGEYVDVLRFGLFANEFYGRFPELEGTRCWRLEERADGQS